MFIRKLIVAFILALLSSLAIAKNQIVYYEPKSVELSGIIKILEFPGPPNYENTKKGDKTEKDAYLILNQAVDIASDNSNDETEKNVKIIQLIVKDSDRKKFEEGNNVRVVGTLSHAVTGHHHARVLLMVEKVEILSKEKMISKKLDITNEDRDVLK